MASNSTVDRPEGIDAKHLLDAAGYDFEDLRIKAQYGVEPTPMLFVDDEPIGDHEDLMRWLARNAH